LILISNFQNSFSIFATYLFYSKSDWELKITGWRVHSVFYIRNPYKKPPKLNFTKKLRNSRIFFKKPTEAQNHEILRNSKLAMKVKKHVLTKKLNFTKLQQSEDKCAVVP